jgi:hypothetical protein
MKKSNEKIFGPTKDEVSENVTAQGSLWSCLFAKFCILFEVQDC